MVEAVLEDCGYAVSTFTRRRRPSGPAESTRFDVVVTDVKMPGIDGWRCWTASAARNCPRR